MIEQTHDEYAQQAGRGGSRRSSFRHSIINLISGNLSIMLGMKGPNLGIVTACTTGLHCIGLAARLIECGDADVMLAGGAEASHLAARRGRLRGGTRPVHAQ